MYYIGIPQRGLSRIRAWVVNGARRVHLSLREGGGVRIAYQVIDSVCVAGIAWVSRPSSSSSASVRCR